MTAGPLVGAGPNRRASVRWRAAWVRPTARLVLSPTAWSVLAAAVVPLVAVRLVVAGSADPPDAVGTVVAVVLAAATAVMLADDAAFALAPVAASPVRRTLQRAAVAAAPAAVGLVAVSAVARWAWSGTDVVDVAACLALMVTAGVATALVPPSRPRDGVGTAIPGTLAVLLLAATPLAVGGLGAPGRWVAIATSWWSTHPGWWALGAVVVAGAVLRRR